MHETINKSECDREHEKMVNGCNTQRAKSSRGKN
jgi:hypothetical protein